MDDWRERVRSDMALDSKDEQIARLLAVARALQDVKDHFANSTVSSGDVFQHPYFRDGIRHAYSVLEEAEDLLDG